MKRIVLLFAVAAFGLNACKNTKKPSDNNRDDQMRKNPLLAASSLPFHAPDFTQIKNTDFEPALKQAMKTQSDKIREIAANPDKPNFENTILALEKSGAQLDGIRHIFYALTSAFTDDTLIAVQKVMAPLFSAHSDEIYLNDALFDRVKAVYEACKNLNLDAESEKLVENYYTDFVIAGAGLDADSKRELKDINSKLASLSNAFNQTLLKGNNQSAPHFKDKKPLEGLSEAQLKAAWSDETNDYVLALQNTTQQPLFPYLENRNTRKTLFESAYNRTEGGPNDTRLIVKQTATLRAQKAALLGFPNYAAWRLQKTMAQKPKTVIDFLDNLVPAATEKAQREARSIQQKIRQTGGAFRLAPWDWNFYAEKVRREKYDFDERAVKPYFKLKNVLEKGVFYAAEKLYGIRFKRRNDIPTYQKDVMVYELVDTTGQPLGLFYGDYFKRNNKRGGAWMSNLVTQSKMMHNKPVIYNVCNFQKPAKGEPALLSYDDVTTLFHEFGHALHGFFADQKYPSLSGTSVARDFVEFPSQFNENWALYPAVLEHYALHYKTGRPMPKALVEKIKHASTFNQGYALTELLEAASLDMQWHSISAGIEIKNVDAFEEQALKRKHLYLKAVPPRYRSTYFAHIFGIGYAAGYYSYLWTEMLAHDAFQWFREHGGLTRSNGDRFRKMILSKGNTEDYQKMYVDWRGRKPSIKPMLKSRGLE